MGLLPTAGVQHTELLVPSQALSLVFPRSLGGGGAGESAVTQLEIGHYLNSRLLRAEILQWHNRCEAWPRGSCSHSGRSVCSLRTLGLPRTRAAGRAVRVCTAHRSWSHQESCAVIIPSGVTDLTVTQCKLNGGVC